MTRRGASRGAEAAGKPAADLSDAEYRALAEFRYALRTFLRFSEDAARAAGLTPAQHQLLLAVRGSPDGAPDITELAERLQLKHHSVVEAVGRAGEAGLVATLPDPDDRRRHRVVLSEAGAAVLRDLSRAHRDELRRFRVEMAEVLRELG